MHMSVKKTGSKQGKAKNREPQKPKNIELELAPALYRLLEEERSQRNSSPEITSDISTFSDIVNEALHSFLPKVDI